jgi:predicted nuclease of predicted toxin-antitoxin system
MKFLLDHDVPEDIIYSLVALGHDVVKLREVPPATSRDDKVLDLARV